MSRNWWDQAMGFGFLGMFGSILFLGFAAVLAALALTAYVNDVLQRRWLWLIGECFFPPVAVVRGLLVWFEQPSTQPSTPPSMQSGQSGAKSIYRSDQPGSRALYDAAPPDRR